jgi:hypothetical protein
VKDQNHNTLDTKKGFSNLTDCAFDDSSFSSKLYSTPSFNVTTKRASLLPGGGRRFIHNSSFLVVSKKTE